jgi:hypothetical protein
MGDSKIFFGHSGFESESLALFLSIRVFGMNSLTGGYPIGSEGVGKMV